MNYRKIVSILGLICGISIYASYKEPFTAHAVINESVVDMSSSFPPPEFPGASPEVNACRRAHQGLYNEVLSCKEELYDCVCLTFPAIVYGLEDDLQTPRNTFWMHKKYLTWLKDVHPDIINALPPAEYGTKPTIVLIYPWNGFSIGTRFVCNVDKCTASEFAIIRPDFVNNTVIEEYIPRAHALYETRQDPAEARKLFVQLINDLVDRVSESEGHEVIPYIWGGGSFITPYKDEFYQADGVWQRDGKNDPYSGYDCSELVMRMAKIAGLYFCWKTTTVMQQALPPITSANQLEEGDLIWVKGHVVIVSNIERNEIIESRSYSSGFGCVHRLKLSQLFDGVETYADLLTRCLANETVTFVNAQGQPYGNPYQFNILKLC